MSSYEMESFFSNETIVIVGGGLAGLTTALQLRKHGIDAHVYEKSQSTAGEGTMITIAPNGTRVLPQELIPKLKKSGLSNFPYVVVDLQGKVVMEVPTGDPDDYPRILIPWKNALKVFSEALPGEFKHYGYECYDVTPLDEGGAVVHFKHGNEMVTVRAGLVIGADGVRSRVRNSIFGYTPIRDTGCTIWRAMIDASLCSNELLLKEACMFTAREQRSAYITNGSDGKLFWALIATDEWTGNHDKGRSKNPVEMKERILNAFKGWEFVTGLVDVTDPEHILERRLTDMDVLPKWHKGHVVVIGDAAHLLMPNVGQGANLSFEDSNELAYQLSTSTSLRTALENFEETRIPRTKKVQDYSRALLERQFSPAGDMVPSKDFYDWLHNYDPRKKSTHCF